MSELLVSRSILPSCGEVLHVAVEPTFDGAPDCRNVELGSDFDAASEYRELLIMRGLFWWLTQIQK